MKKTIVEVLTRVATAFRGYAELPADIDDDTKGKAWLELCFAIDEADGGGLMHSGDGYRGGVLAEAGIPMIMQCPQCRARHIDRGEFEFKPHHTHACQKCGFCWRPALVPTLGVKYLPGFYNGPTEDDT